MNKAGMALGAVLAAPLLGALPAEAQITYQTLQDPGTTTTGVTGIRGDNITGSYSHAWAGCSIASTPASSSLIPWQRPTAPTSPARSRASPTARPSARPNGILRAVGTFTPTGRLGRSELHLGQRRRARTAGHDPERPRRLQHDRPQPVRQPGGRQLQHHVTTLGTIFIYDIANGSFTTISVPGASSPSAYGIWGNRIAGGFIDAWAGAHAFIFNQTHRRLHDVRRAGRRHRHALRGHHGRRPRRRVQPRSRSRPTSSACTPGRCMSTPTGVATWTELTVPGATVTSPTRSTRTSRSASSSRAASSAATSPPCPASTRR